MGGQSALSAALELENDDRRTRDAYVAWRALGHECDMPYLFQQLFECTLLDEEQLARAISRKIDLLQGEVKNHKEKLEGRKNELKDLEQVAQEKHMEGTFHLKEKDIKRILWNHYKDHAAHANKKLTIEVIMSVDPITDEIWADVNYMEE